MSEIPQITGRQIAAARALAGIGEDDLAERANISVPTLRRMEASEGPALGMANNVAAVRRAFESAGVEFTNGGQPGVRMRAANAVASVVIAKGAEARADAETAVDTALADVEAPPEEKRRRKRKLTRVPRALKEK